MWLKVGDDLLLNLDWVEEVEVVPMVPDCDGPFEVVARLNGGRMRTIRRGLTHKQAKRVLGLLGDLLLAHSMRGKPIPREALDALIKGFEG